MSFAPLTAELNRHHCHARRIEGSFFSYDRLQFGNENYRFTLSCKDQFYWYDYIIAFFFGVQWVEFSINEEGTQQTDRIRTVYLNVNDLFQTLAIEPSRSVSLSKEALEKTFCQVKKALKARQSDPMLLSQVFQEIECNHGLWEEELERSGTFMIKKPKGLDREVSVYVAKSRKSHKIKLFINLGQKTEFGTGNFKMISKALEFGTGKVKILGKTVLSFVHNKGLTRADFDSIRENARSEGHVLQMFPTCEALLQAHYVEEITNSHLIDKQYLFMPFCELGDLFSYPYEELLDEEKHCIALDIIDALQTMHDSGYLHQDIKTENILLYQDALGRIRAKVGDFGFSQTVDSVLKSSGTVAYSSPEKLLAVQEKRFTSELGICADVWSLGIVLHELYFNDHPFEEHVMLGSDYKSLVSKIEKICKERSQKATKAIEKAIWGLLNPRYRDRLSLKEMSKKIRAIQKSGL